MHTMQQSQQPSAIPPAPAAPAVPATPVATVHTQALMDVEVQTVARLATLEAERDALRTGVNHLPSEERRVVRQKINSLDAVINGEQARLNRVRNELKSLQSTYDPSAANFTATAGPLSKNFRLNNDQLAGAAGFMLLMPLMIAWAYRIMRRPHVAPSPAEDPRFQRLEQAVDAIAIEVERIGESQRFQAKLSAERPQRSEVLRD